MSWWVQRKGWQVFHRHKRNGVFDNNVKWPVVVHITIRLSINSTLVLLRWRNGWLTDWIRWFLLFPVSRAPFSKRVVLWHHTQKIIKITLGTTKLLFLFSWSPEDIGWLLTKFSCCWGRTHDDNLHTSILSSFMPSGWPTERSFNEKLVNATDYEHETACEPIWYYLLKTSSATSPGGAPTNAISGNTKDSVDFVYISIVTLDQEKLNNNG